MLLPTAWILTCTYKGQAAPTGFGRENTNSSNAFWEEFNLQMTKNAHKNTGLKPAWKLTFSPNTSVDFSVVPAKEKEINQTIKWIKNPRVMHFSGILFFFLILF